MNREYVETVRFLLDIAPMVFESATFALKGGTAINLFIRDMPRLSVDLDLVLPQYTRDREADLKLITDELFKISQKLQNRGIQFTQKMRSDDSKLLLSRGGIQVKVEVNSVFRGTLLPLQSKNLSQSAQERFTCSLEVPVLSEPELYGSKIVAALDRQHPRDFFDVLGMYETHGRLTPETVECFVVYLAAHNRPVHEVLFSNDQDFSREFQTSFQGMALKPIDLDGLFITRKRLREDMIRSLLPNQKEFLLSLVKADPNFDLLPFPRLQDLPAIRWKLQNLEKLKKSNKKKFLAQSEQLAQRFS